MNASIRPLKESDLATAKRIISLAFGTFLGAPEPEKFWSDLDYAGTRWRADPTSAFAAEIDGELVGSNFATRWGSVGFFGPITVHPGVSDQGIVKQLMVPVMECFDRWKVTHAGLFTFAHSPKHIGLYFSPRSCRSRCIHRRADPNGRHIPRFQRASERHASRLVVR
jgi:hypothetical protein